MACVVSIVSKVSPGLSGAAVTSATSKVTGARKFISHRNDIILSLTKHKSQINSSVSCSDINGYITLQIVLVLVMHLRKQKGQGRRLAVVQEWLEYQVILPLFLP